MYSKKHNCKQCEQKCTIGKEVLNEEKGLKVSKYQFVVDRDFSESREENPIFILTLHDDLVLDEYGELVIDNYGELDKEKLLFRVF